MVNNPKAGQWYNNELYFSVAYQSLTKSARNLFHCLRNELRFEKKFNSGRRYLNNGDVSFTIIQYKEKFSTTSETYIKARNQLIKVGLIKQTYRGGFGKGSMAKYKILALTELPKVEERWRNYPEQNWESDIPKSKGLTIGKNTRWKKGQSGRKIKSQPTKSNANGVLKPYKIESLL